jgi:hypothetical protein
MGLLIRLSGIPGFDNILSFVSLATLFLFFGRCGSLLSYRDFRLRACEFFKVICQRYDEANLF